MIHSFGARLLISQEIESGTIGVVSVAAAGPPEKGSPGFWGTVGLVGDASAIVTLLTQGMNVVAAVLCVVGILAGIRMITLRLRGVKAVGAIIVMLGVLALAVMVIGPEKVRAWASSPEQEHPWITLMSGGCESFQVFAQNRWNPVDAGILHIRTIRLRGIRLNIST